jgi:hypothetical protein
MRIVRSRLGWLLVAIYVVVFIVAYFDAMSKRGVFLYDIWLDILTLPYIAIVGRLLLQSPTFEVHAHEPLGLVPAVIFCSAILLLIGAAIEGGIRRAVRRGRSVSGKPDAPGPP